MEEEEKPQRGGGENRDRRRTGGKGEEIGERAEKKGGFFGREFVVRFLFYFF